MNAFPRQLIPGGTFAFDLGLLAGTMPAEDPAPNAGRVSKRMSDAILAEFKNVEIQPRPVVELALVVTDPDVVVLPEMVVRERLDLRSLNSASLTPPTGSIPLKLGTGITEYRGKKVSVLTQRVLFIPLGFKLAW